MTLFTALVEPSRATLQTVATLGATACSYIPQSRYTSITSSDGERHLDLDVLESNREWIQDECAGKPFAMWNTEGYLRKVITHPDDYEWSIVRAALTECLTLWERIPQIIDIPWGEWGVTAGSDDRFRWMNLIAMRSNLPILMPSIYYNTASNWFGKVSEKLENALAIAELTGQRVIPCIYDRYLERRDGMKYLHPLPLGQVKMMVELLADFHCTEAIFWSHTGKFIANPEFNRVIVDPDSAEATTMLCLSAADVMLQKVTNEGEVVDV